MNFTVPALTELTTEKLHFIVRHEVLHRLFVINQSHKMGDDTVQLPVNGLMVMEDSDNVLAARRLLDNYTVGFVDDRMALQTLMDLNMPFDQIVDTMTRYEWIKIQ